MPDPRDNPDNSNQQRKDPQSDNATAEVNGQIDGAAGADEQSSDDSQNGPWFDLTSTSAKY